MNNTAVVCASGAAGAAPPRRRLRMTLNHDVGALVALVFLLLLVAAAVFAPWVATHDPMAQSVVHAFEGPSPSHWLGTDQYGRDVFSRIIYGTRPALMVGVASVALAMLVGIPVGIVAGLRLGWVDRIVGWLVDVMLAFPPLLLALLIVTLLGSSLTMLIVAIGASSVPMFVRLARGSTLIVRNLDYVHMSRSFGASDLRIIVQHILPNIAGPIIVMATLTVAGAVREEASLSFLGLGILPPAPSWGNLIQDGITHVFEAPGLAVLPGITLTLAVLAFNLLGDALRDLLDPHGFTQRRSAAKS